ncbi:MAG: hypothetical protein J6R68_06150 [Clostridia bacterium]|nr:hypothetical protein [Clostridia bacterium]MBO7288607.1 hypothetical protein [Clostridia bacterium]
MYKRYYDGYGTQNMQKNGGEIIVPENLASTVSKSTSPQVQDEKPLDDISISACPEKRNILNLPCEIDDLILIGILLFILLGNDNNDNDNGSDIFTLIIIGIILFSDIL